VSEPRDNLGQDEDLELQALQRQLDDAFETTRPRHGFEDELWLRMQSSRPARSRLRDAWAGFWQGIRAVPAVPAAAVAVGLVVVIGVVLVGYSGLLHSGGSTATSAGGGFQGPQSNQYAGDFGRLPAPVVAGQKTGGATQFLVDRAMRLAMRIGTGPLQAGLADRSDAPVMAIYSSALANVYFTDVSHRMDVEEVEARAPGLLDSLVAHPGIGLLLIRQAGRTVALHREGRTILESADEQALEFLRIYDDPVLVRDHILHLSAMPSAGDLLVFGSFDGSRVVNFEDHVGAHGGLGGVQQFPFMVSPRATRASYEGVTDATQLHPLFVRRYQLNGKEDTAFPSRPAADGSLSDAAAG